MVDFVLGLDIKLANRGSGILNAATDNDFGIVLDLLHPDVGAKALAIGCAKEGHTGHRKLDQIDIAGHRIVEDRPHHDLCHTQNHQQEDGAGGQKVRQILYWCQYAVK